MADRARQAIHLSGLSQREVAAHLGLDETKLSKSLSGVRRLTATELFSLATVTGATVQWLLGGEALVSVPPSGSDVQESGQEAHEHSPRQRAIVEAAWELVADRGFDEVRVLDIAGRAGVSTATVHHHFPHKRDLFGAALKYSVKLAFDRQVAWLSDLDDAQERLRRLLELQSPIGAAARQEWSIWVQAWARNSVGGRAPDPEYIESYRRWWSTVRAAVVDGQTQGCVRPAAPDALADEITSVLDGYGLKVLTGTLSMAAMRRQMDAYLDRAVFIHVPDKESS